MGEVLTGVALYHSYVHVAQATPGLSVRSIVTSSPPPVPPQNPALEFPSNVISYSSGALIIGAVTGFDSHFVLLSTTRAEIYPGARLPYTGGCANTALV